MLKTLLAIVVLACLPSPAWALRYSFVPGATSQTVFFPAYDLDATTPTKKTGLAYTAFTCTYSRNGAATATLTTATQTVTGSWATGGLVEQNATGPASGTYRLDVPNEVIAAGATVAMVSCTATDMAPVDIHIDLNGVNIAKNGISGLAYPADGVITNVVDNGTTVTVTVNTDIIAATNQFANEVWALVLDPTTGARQSIGCVTATTTAGGPADTVTIGDDDAAEIAVNDLLYLIDAPGCEPTSGVVSANVTQVDGVALDAHDAGSVPADVRTIVGTAAPQTSGELTVRVSDGTGTGQLSCTLGVCAGNLTQIAGQAQDATDLGDLARDGYDPTTNYLFGVQTAGSVTNPMSVTTQDLAKLGYAGTVTISAINTWVTGYGNQVTISESGFITANGAFTGYALRCGGVDYVIAGSVSATNLFQLDEAKYIPTTTTGTCEVRAHP